MSRREKFEVIVYNLSDGLFAHGLTAEVDSREVAFNPLDRHLSINSNSTHLKRRICGSGS